MKWDTCRREIFNIMMMMEAVRRQEEVEKTRDEGVTSVDG